MNQEDRYNVYEPEIDLKDLLFYILYKWRHILLLAATFCVLLSGFGFIRNMNENPEKEPKKIRKYKLELARYQLDMAGYELAMADYQERLAQQEIYMAESELMRIDPYKKPKASVDVIVKLDDAEWEALPSNINSDPTDSLIKIYTSGFAENLDWHPIETLTGDREIYLKELLAVNTDYNSNSFTISVIHSNADMAQQILDIIIGQVMDKYQGMEDGVGRHTLFITNSSLAYSIDISLADKQKGGSEALADYEQAILDCQEALEELAENEPQKPLVIGFIKYPAAGFLLGIFLAVAFHGASYLLGGRLHREDELKDRYGYPLLGVYFQPEKSSFLAGIDRCLDRMSGIAGKVGRNEASHRIAVNIANIANGKKSILVTGTAGIEKLKGVISEVTPMLDGMALTAGADLNQDTKTLELLAGCDGVILVEEKGKAKITFIQQEHENIKILGKPVIGYILL